MQGLMEESNVPVRQEEINRVPVGEQGRNRASVGDQAGIGNPFAGAFASTMNFPTYANSVLNDKDHLGWKFKSDHMSELAKNFARICNKLYRSDNKLKKRESLNPNYVNPTQGLDPKKFTEEQVAHAFNVFVNSAMFKSLDLDPSAIDGSGGQQKAAALSIIQYLCESFLENTKRPKKQKVFHFHGRPGSGKTLAIIGIVHHFLKIFVDLGYRTEEEMKKYVLFVTNNGFPAVIGSLQTIDSFINSRNPNDPKAREAGFYKLIIFDEYSQVGLEKYMLMHGMMISLKHGATKRARDYQITNSLPFDGYGIVLVGDPGLPWQQNPIAEFGLHCTDSQLEDWIAAVKEPSKEPASSRATNQGQGATGNGNTAWQKFGGLIEDTPDVIAAEIVKVMSFLRFQISPETNQNKGGNQQQQHIAGSSHEDLSKAFCNAVRSNVDGQNVQIDQLLERVDAICARFATSSCSKTAGVSITSQKRISPASIWY
jgi:hypothetical protein